MKKIFLILGILFASNLLWAQWEPDVRLTCDTSFSTSAQYGSWGIASSGDTVHIVWYDKRDGNYEIYYKHSTDAGLTWGADMRLTNDLSDSKLPSIALSGSLVHIVWKDNRDGHYETYYKRSVDRGETWENDVRLTNTPSYNSNTISVSASGLWVHVVWSVNDTPYGPVVIRYKNSADGGLTWGPETLVTDVSMMAFNPTLACMETDVYIVCQDNDSKQLFFNHSFDGGLTWGSGYQLTDNLNLQPCYPSIAISGSVVHVVWNAFIDGNWKVYYKRSSDGGLSWWEDVCLTNFPAGNQLGPSVAVSGSVVHVAWRDSRYFETEIHYKRSDDGGLNWNPDVRLTDTTGNSQYPTIAVSGPIVHVIWTDFRDGNPEIYYKRDPTGGYAVGIGHDLACNSDKLFSIYPNPASSVVHINSNVELRNPEVNNNETNLFIIWNLLGEAVKSKQITNRESVIDISGLQDGLYFTGIKSVDKKISTTKLIILK